ncbi:MAG TPA: hypothetical protein VF929_03480 [Gemmatimonadaceae bacterium]
MLRAKRVGALFGLLAVIGLALVGIQTLTRGTPFRAVRTVGHHETPAPVSDSQFVRTLELYTGLHLFAGNAVEMLNNGTVYAKLWEDLRAARSTITVQMYYSQPGAVADTMASILSERA